ncbi:MAG: lactonase family protein [Bacteroidetes Order II. Incertae sedis bacterium]|nr:lactonase family protein [Bacteroidetes Order II. bacterium]
MMNRRTFLHIAGLGMASMYSAEVKALGKDEVPFYLGTYTGVDHAPLGKSEGIYRAVVHTKTGKIRLLGLVAKVDDPSFLACSPDGRYLFAVHERDPGEVSAYAIQPDGGLLLLNRRPTMGPHPCFVSVDPSGKVVLVANYSGGNVASYKIEGHGQLSEPVSVYAHTGRGADPDRQAMPHAHAFKTAPGGEFAYAADLGTDKVYGYRILAETGLLQPTENHFVHTGTGSGPRHMAFSPNGRWLFMVNELDNTILSIRLNIQNGKMTIKNKRSSLPANFVGTSYVADVHLSPDGRFIYVSNRGHNSIFVGKINLTNGVILPVQQIACGGDWPRNFGMDPSGKLLLVANERSGKVVSFQRNSRSGQLTPTGNELALPKPVCIAFPKT